MALSEQNITVNGRAVRYYVDGDPENRTLFLLHGGFGDAWLHWANIMPLLADDYYVIAPDLPGYGQSDLLPDMTLNSLVNWTQQLMNALEITQAAVIGNSFGGLIARLLAATHPTYVPVLILVNGGVIPGVPGIAQVIARMPVFGKLLFSQLSKSTSSRANLASAIHVKEVLKDDFHNRVQANVNGLAELMRGLTISPKPTEKTPRIPVLMLWGEEDVITPVQVGETIKENIPGAQFSVIAECGHMPHVEVPEVFVWQVKSFLNGLDRIPKSL